MARAERPRRERPLRHGALRRWGNLGHLPTPRRCGRAGETHQPLSALPSYPFALPLPYFIFPLENIFPDSIRCRKYVCNISYQTTTYFRAQISHPGVDEEVMGTRAAHGAEPTPAPGPGTPIARSWGCLWPSARPQEAPGTKPQPRPQPTGDAALVPSEGCRGWTGGPSHMFGIWENKRKEPKVWELGRTGNCNQKLWAKKKENNSLPLTIPHKNVREIIKSIWTAGGPRRRHRRAQRDGLAPISG